MVRCQSLPWGGVAVDICLASPRIFMPNDVPPCHYHRQGWAWPCYLMGQTGTLSRMRCGKGTNCEGALLTLFLPGGHCGSLLQMFSSYGGCQGRYTVMRRWRHVFAMRSWTLSKNASGISGFLHYQGLNQDRAQPTSLGSTPKLNSTSGTLPLMIGSWALSETPAKKLWLWQEMPADGHWWLQHFLRTKLRWWATLSATVANALKVTDAQAATGKGDPRLQIIKPKSSRWCDTMGTLLKVSQVTQSFPIEMAGKLHPLITWK